MMMVVIIKKAPNKLRGGLSIYLHEISGGVYIGNFSIKIREIIWEQILNGIEEGNAIMAWEKSNSEFGFELINTSLGESNILDFFNQ